MSLDFKWFLALSVAAHGAVMFAWIAPLPDAGSPGRVLLLDITEKAGRVESPAATVAANSQHKPGATTARQASARRPVSAARPASSVQPADANPTPEDARQAVPADPENIESGSTPTLAASRPLPNREESDRLLRDSVLQLITQRLSYPAIARRKGWQGVVTLELHIESDGLISDLQVNETSGYPALDQAAMKSLQLASIPGAGQWLHGRSIDMLVPVEYRLLDS